MSKNHFLPLFLLGCAPLLASCSTITNGSTQQVTFKTIGTDDAYCTVLLGVNDYAYDVRPPQTIWVQRTKEKMTIDCTAPGNRKQHMKIDSSVAGSALLNGVTAGTTLLWDAGSGAMYKYPEVITIDFTTSIAKDQYLPSYENRGALDPKDQGIEYMGEDTPVLGTDKAGADRLKAAYATAERLEAEEAANAAEKQRRLDSVDGGFYGDKGGAVKTAPAKSSDEKVQIAPLSEAAPAPKTSPADAGITVPRTNPQLGKPIFPSSTTF